MHSKRSVSSVYVGEERHSPVDAVDALGVVPAGIAGALVDVDFAVLPGRALPANALVAVDEVPTLPSVLARVRGTLVDLGFAHVPRVARVADALEGVLPVDALAIPARGRLAVVDVRLARHACGFECYVWECSA